MLSSHVFIASGKYGLNSYLPCDPSSTSEITGWSPNPTTNKEEKGEKEECRLEGRGKEKQGIERDCKKGKGKEGEGGER